METNHCTECHADKSWDKFSKDKSMPHGHINQCKACLNARRKLQDSYVSKRVRREKASTKKETITRLSDLWRIPSGVRV